MYRVFVAVFAGVVAGSPARAAGPMPLWEIDTAQPKLQTRQVDWIGFSPDGKSLCAGVNYLDPEKRDEVFQLPALTARLLVWDVSIRKEKHNLALDMGSDFTLANQIDVTSEGTVIIGGKQAVRLKDGKSMGGGRVGNLTGLWVKRGSRDSVLIEGNQFLGYQVVFETLQAFDPSHKELKSVGVLGSKLTPVRMDYAICSAAASGDLSKLAITATGKERGTDVTPALGLYSVTVGQKLKIEEIANVKTQHASAIHSSKFSPDGQTLALGSFDCTVSLWDVTKAGKNWKARATIHAGTFTVSCLAFSPDGRTLAAMSTDVKKDDLYMIDVRGGKLVASRRLGGGLTAIAYSPDGTLLATGDSQGRIRVWNAAAMRGD